MKYLMCFISNISKLPHAITLIWQCLGFENMYFFYEIYEIEKRGEWAFPPCHRQYSHFWTNNSTKKLMRSEI
jgi:hypothetical protein